MDIRLKGNTIGYALPDYAGKTGKAQAVREANVEAVLQWQESDSICRRAGIF